VPVVRWSCGGWDVDKGVGVITIRRKEALVVVAFAAIGLIATFGVECGSEMGGVPPAWSAPLENP